MKRTTTCRAYIVPTALVALAACGGGATQVTQDNPDAIYALDVGTPAEALENGIVFVATSQSALQLASDFDNDTTSFEAEGFSIQKAGNGFLIMTVNGQQYIFDPSSDAAFENEQGGYAGLRIDTFNETFTSGSYLQVFGTTEQISDLVDGSGEAHSQIIDYTVALTDGSGGLSGAFGYAIIGTQTTPEIVAGLGSSTYQGRFAGEILPAEGFTSRADRYVLDGLANITLNFDGSSVSGFISGLEGKQMTNNVAGATDVLSGELQLIGATISGNGFEGTMTPSASLSADLDLTGSNFTYTGNFYGPSAEEVAGVAGGDYTTGSGDTFNLLGGFKAE